MRWGIDMHGTLLAPLSGEQRDRALAALRSFSPREEQVFRGLARGLTAQQSADQLGVSRRTVELYRAAIFDKLGVRRVVEAVRIAIAVLLEGRGGPPR